MKIDNITKLLACVLVSWMAVFQSSAVTVSFTVGAGGAHNSTNIIPASAILNSIKIDTGSSGGATNLIYALTDFPGFNAANGWGYIKMTNAAYAASGQYLTNITKTITNFAGLGQTTFPAGSTITNIITISNVVFTYTNTVAGGSNDWRRIAVGNVSSNSSVTLTGPFPLTYGLGFTNNNIGKDVVFTIDYDPSL